MTTTIPQPAATPEAAEAVAQAPAIAPAPPLGRIVAHGAFWTILCAGLNKVVTFLGQIALAWFLVPEDFGVVAMAMSVAMVSQVILSGGIRDVLIQRHDDYERVVSDAFWLAIVLHVLGAVLIAGSIPLAVAIYDDPKIIGLLLIFAFAEPLFAACPVYSARLYLAGKYKLCAVIHLLVGLITTSVAVGLAAMDFGPYSIVLSLVIARACLVIFYRLAANAIKLARPNIRRSMALIAPWLGMVVPAIWLLAQLHVGVLVLGSSTNSHTTGLYFWGYQVAVQLIFLLATTLQPMLVREFRRCADDPARQQELFIRTSRSLFTLIVPVSVLQFVLVPIVLPFVVSPAWNEALPVVQALTIGTLLTPFVVCSRALRIATGEYRALTITTMFAIIVLAISFKILLWMGVSFEWAGCMAVLLSHVVYFSSHGLRRKVSLSPILPYGPRESARLLTGAIRPAFVRS